MLTLTINLNTKLFKIHKHIQRQVLFQMRMKMKFSRRLKTTEDVLEGSLNCRSTFLTLKFHFLRMKRSGSIITYLYMVKLNWFSRFSQRKRILRKRVSTKMLLNISKNIIKSLIIQECLLYILGRRSTIWISRVMMRF